MNQNYAKSLLMNTVKGEGREMVDWIFYDSLFMTASATQTLTFFQNTIGSVGRARTNMKSAGMLPSPQSFAVTELGFHTTSVLPIFMSGGAAPAEHPENALYKAFTWDFILEPSRDYEGYGHEFWHPLSYLNDTAAALAQTIVPATPQKCRKFDVPILIPTNRAFSVVASFTLGADAGGFVAATSKLFCYIKGYLRRNA